MYQLSTICYHFLYPIGAKALNSKLCGQTTQQIRRAKPKTKIRRLRDTIECAQKNINKIVVRPSSMRLYHLNGKK